MRAWVLNFDADDELARGAPTTLGAEARARSISLREKLLGSLIEVGDRVLDAAEARAVGCEGLAWCPTPAALARLRAAGAVTPVAPPVAVLRAVNHRSWAARRGLYIPRSAWLIDEAELRQHLSAPWPVGGWLLRRPFGFAGRGRLHLRAPADLEDRRAAGWLRNSLVDDGLLVEPCVRRLDDYGLHGWLSTSGECARGELTAQRCAADGRWESSVRAPWSALLEAERDALLAAFDDTSRGLREAGYFGPFGVDAFAWEDELGARRFQPRCEVNARYSMGWAAGMGALRPDLVTTAR